MSTFRKPWFYYGGAWHARGEASVVVAPTSSVTAAFTSTRSGLTVTVDGSTSTDDGAQITGYAWDFGDGTTAVGVTPAPHTYSTGGSKTVTLTVTDENNVSGTTSRTIVLGVPVAAFTFQTTNLTANLDGSGSTDQGATIQAWAWDFGDGTTGTGQAVTHTYKTAGQYQVRLTVTDTANLTASVTHAVPATVPAGQPTASFTSLVSNLTVSLDASSSTDPTSTITSYAWAYGDGTTGSGKTTKHTYATGGAKTVMLTVTDASGQTANVSHGVTAVTPTGNVPPTASFTAAVSGLAVSVNGSASSDADGTITAFAWDFGDGGTAKGVTASHTYSGAGAYTVRLTVTDDANSTGTASKAVTVSTAGGGTQPSGTNITPIQSLSGSRLSDRINSSKTSGVSFPNGTFTWDDFQFPVTASVNATTSGGGMRITAPDSLLGTPGYGTILKMNAGSTAKYTDMTQSVGNLHYMGLFSQMKLLQDVWIQGVSIGDLSKLLNGSAASNGSGKASLDSPYIYSGVYLYHITNGSFTVRRVKVSDIPGSDHVNPGETGVFNWGGGGSMLFDTVEIAGGGIGATGFLINNLSAGSVLDFENCYVHDLKYSAAWSFYKAPGSHKIVNARVTGNRTHFNHESNGSDTTVTYTSPVIGPSVSHDFSFGSNNGSVKCNIKDPVDFNGNPLTTVKATILSGYTTQKQLKSDVKVFRGTTDVTASVLKWS